LLTLIHEFNHWIRRYITKGAKNVLAAGTKETTINIDGEDEFKCSEGGQIKFYYLFGKRCFEYIDIKDCLFVLMPSSWNMISCRDFRKEYKSYKAAFKNKIEIEDKYSFGLKELGSVLDGKSEVSKDLVFKYFSNEVSNNVSFQYPTGCMRL
jgi:hypothetical protein